MEQSEKIELAEQILSSTASRINPDGGDYHTHDDIIESMLDFEQECRKREGEDIIKAQIKENESILKMAELHMDERSVFVLKSRIAELSLSLPQTPETK